MITIYRALPIEPSTKVTFDGTVQRMQVSELSAGDVVEWFPGGRGGIFRGVDGKGHAMYEHVDCVEEFVQRSPRGVK